MGAPAAGLRDPGDSPDGKSRTWRCLAAWWRIADDPRLPALAPEVIAAALAAMTGRRAGWNRTRPAAALDHGADVADVNAAGRKLQTLLGLSDARWW